MIALRLRVLSLLVIAMFSQGCAPLINDISTDLQDPPVIYEVVDGEISSTTLTYPDDFKKEQRDGYPEITTQLFSYSPEEILPIVSEAINDIPRMKIIGETKTRDEILIQCVATTAIFRFKDDLSIRIREETESSSKVDIRSRSRIGKGDLGKNASRIQNIFSRIRNKITH